MKQSSDHLSDVLAICRAERAVTARFFLNAPWALASEGVPGTMIRVGQGQPYWLQVRGQAPVQVMPGDLVLLPLGSPHVMASDLALPPISFAQMIERFAQGPKDENPLTFEHGGSGASSRIDSVLLWISAHCRHTILPLLPPLLHIPAQQAAPPAILVQVLQTLIEDSLARRPGWRLAAMRLGELAMVHVLSNYFAAQQESEQGWVRGLADAQIATALAAIHGNPSHDWTLQTLAREAAMSRSRFAEKFKALVGASPMAYLLQQRMAHAAQQLESGLPLVQVAENCGYESERVFARAFKRWCGLPPRAYQRKNQALRKEFATLK
ncbi:MAG: AraC family transcriptional regulator [Comamonas sp.]|jgi:AraC-like DNA-binding protein|uniref:AraC family transcriptional regulator n=1 Tax=Comamonas sp. TaxID=34028 RepID=UPI002841CA0F|nr:AraC family transcriptional regulator [Comamonas sp.]MDR3066009.1 AraC family transcriptional regulator [Comamonas sp.]